jgi:hypothetical protein
MQRRSILDNTVLWEAPLTSHILIGRRSVLQRRRRACSREGGAHSCLDVEGVAGCQLSRWAGLNVGGVLGGACDGGGIHRADARRLNCLAVSVDELATLRLVCCTIFSMFPLVYGQPISFLNLDEKCIFLVYGQPISFNLDEKCIFFTSTRLERYQSPSTVIISNRKEKRLVERSHRLHHNTMSQSSNSCQCVPILLLTRFHKTHWSSESVTNLWSLPRNKKELEHLALSRGNKNEIRAPFISQKNIYRPRNTAQCAQRTAPNKWTKRAEIKRHQNRAWI